MVVAEIWLNDFLLRSPMFSTTYMGLIGKCVLAAVLMAGMQLIIFRRSEELQAVYIYAGEIKNIIRNKFRARKDRC